MRPALPDSVRDDNTGHDSQPHVPWTALATTCRCGKLLCTAIHARGAGVGNTLQAVGACRAGGLADLVPRVYCDARQGVGADGDLYRSASPLHT